MIVNLNSQMEIAEFVKDSNNIERHFWFRDARSDYKAVAIFLRYGNRSLDHFEVEYNGISVRPAYTLDLSGLDYIIE